MTENWQNEKVKIKNKFKVAIVLRHSVFSVVWSLPKDHLLWRETEDVLSRFPRGELNRHFSRFVPISTMENCIPWHSCQITRNIWTQQWYPSIRIRFLSADSFIFYRFSSFAGILAFLQFCFVSALVSNCAEMTVSTIQGLLCVCAQPFGGFFSWFLSMLFKYCTDTLDLIVLGQDKNLSLAFSIVESFSCVSRCRMEYRNHEISE